METAYDEKQLFEVKHWYIFQLYETAALAFAFFVCSIPQRWNRQNWVNRPKLERASLNIFLKLGMSVPNSYKNVSI